MKNTVNTTAQLLLSTYNINHLQPIQLINYNVEMVKPGKFPAGKTELPFEFPLKPKTNKSLYETYHGVFVNIQVSWSNLRVI